MGIQSKAYRVRKRKEALAALGGKCARCDVDDWRCLQIDHINGGGAKERREARNSGTISRYIGIIQFPDLQHLQVLCANCNWIKRYEEDESSKRY